MKKACLAVVVLTLLIVALYGAREARAQSLNLAFDSALFVSTGGEVIKVNIQNADTAAHNFRVVFRGTISGTSLTTVQDTGVLSIPSMSGTHSDLVLVTGTVANDYSVEITTDSHQVVPTLSVIPMSTGLPRYWQAPSDFSKF